MSSSTERASTTNSRYSSLTSDTAGDDDQFDAMMSRLTVKPISDDVIASLDDNRYKNYDGKFFSDDVSLYKNITSEATFNTFKYAFYRFKKGIFVKIVDNRLVNFIPFSNHNYYNNWSDLLKTDPSFSSLNSFLKYAAELAGYRFDANKVNPPERWVCNNAIFRYEKRQRETSHNIDAIKDYFETLCRERKIPDVELFVNRRDNPMLSRLGYEPYNHLYGSKFVPLTYDPLLPEFEPSYCPIYSMSSAPEYADVEMPTYEDWTRCVAQKNDDAKSFNKIRRDVDWSRKASKAVFRGSSTGSGTSADTNQRLRALDMMESDDADRIDVGITKWNNRPRKYETDKYLSVIRRSSYPVANRLTLQEQTDGYKYILNLEGHVAAFRLGYELSSRSVVLLAGSRWSTWFYKFLIPYVHYVPVKESLDDLFDRIDWCRRNDAKCVEIVDNANKFYDEYLSYDAILDYGQKLFVEHNATCGSYAYIKLASEIMFRQESDAMDAKLAEWHERADKKLYQYDVPSTETRTYGQLKGYDEIIRRSATDPVVVESVFSGRNSSVELFRSHGIFVAKKSYANDEKMRENVHENYIGTTAIRQLCQLYPNFPYVFTPRAKEYVYVEFMPGISLRDWISSTAFTTKKFNEILVQMSVALEAAQNVNGFVHYDAYPWNVILQFLPGRIPVNYAVRYDKRVTLFVDVIVVFVDFGKSRALVYERGGLVERSRVNIFSDDNSLIDVLTILSSSCNLIANDKDKKRYYDFISVAGLNASPSRVNYYSKYGTLFSWKNENRLSPIDFAEYAIRNYELTIDGRDFYVESDGITAPNQYIMMAGNPAFTESFAETGNEAESLLRAILAIDRRAIAYSDNSTLNEIVHAHFVPLTKWIESRLDRVYETYKSDLLVKTWNKVRSYMYGPRQKASSTQLSVDDYPTNDISRYDRYVTPEVVNEALLNYADSRSDYGADWITARLACSSTERSLTPSTTNSGYESLNAISRRNWIFKLSNEIYE